MDWQNNSQITLDLLDGARLVDQPQQRDLGERYKFLDNLGTGGQGHVFVAYDQLLERQVAIKMLRIPRDPGLQERLRREAKLLARLEHPNIAPTYDLGVDSSGSPYFVMKRLQGETLETVLTSSKNVTDASVRLRFLTIFLQICQAVSFAHSQQILHLDLKPDNIIIGNYGEIYVLDWGIASLSSQTEELSTSGTPGYIPPERFQGVAADEKSDQYALGVILYRLLTGKTLSKSVTEVSYQADLRQAETPPQLAAITSKALSTLPADRYKTVSDFAADINKFLAWRPVSVYKETWTQRLSRLAQQHRGAILLSLLTLVAIAAIFLWRQERLSKELIQQQQQDSKEQAAAITRKAARAGIQLEKAKGLLEILRPRLQELTSQSEELGAESVDQALLREQSLTLLQPVFDLLDSSLAEQADNADALYLKAQIYENLGDMAAALTNYQATYKADRSRIMARYHSGRLLADVWRNFDQAAAEFRAINRVDPANEFSELGQARIAIAAGHLSKSLQHTDKAARINPALPDIWFVRGLALSSAPDDPVYNINAAIAAYNRYLQSQRDNPAAWLNRADLKAKQGNISEALSDYGEALRLDADLRWARINRGTLLIRKFAADSSEFKLGTADLDQILQQFPDDVWALLARSQAAEKNQEIDHAYELLTHAANVTPSEPTVYYKLGLLDLRSGNIPKATEYLQKAVQLSSPDTERQILAVRKHRLGMALFISGDLEGADQQFQSALVLRKEGKIYSGLMHLICQYAFGQGDLTNKNRDNNILAQSESSEKATIVTSFNSTGEKSSLAPILTNVSETKKLADEIVIKAPQLANLRVSPDLRECFTAEATLPWLQSVAKVVMSGAEARIALQQSNSSRAMCETLFYLGCFATVRQQKISAEIYYSGALQTGANEELEWALAKCFLSEASGLTH